MIVDDSNNNVNNKEKAVLPDEADIRVAVPICRSVILVSRISCGEHHVLLLGSHYNATTNKLFTFGLGNFGELGAGDLIVSSSHPKFISVPDDLHPVSISAATFHSVVVGLRGQVYTFGCGAYFRLGHGDDKNRYFPTLVDSLPAVYDLSKSTSMEFDDNGAREEVKICACSLWHTIVVFENNDVYAWGWNKFNQMGGTDEMVTRPRRISELDCPRLLGDDRAGDDDNIMKVECNVRYTALLTKSGRVLFMGQLGLSPIEGLSSDCSDRLDAFQKHVSVVSTALMSARDDVCSSTFAVVARSAYQLYGCPCNICKVGSTESSIIELQARKVTERTHIEELVHFNGMSSLRWSLLLSCG